MLLQSGRQMPRLAFGTGTQWFKTEDGKSRKEGSELALASALHTALDAGFRHIDEAEMYGTQAHTGPALQDWLSKHPDVKREDLFITSKIWKGMTNVRETVQQTLQSLNTPYLDLYLVHAPFLKENDIDADLHAVWKELEALKDEGLIRDLGVSNFHVSHLKDLAAHCKHKPTVNQIECHPHLLQPELMEYCKQENIVVTSYGPLTPLSQKHEPTMVVINDIAAKTGLTTGQVLLQWNLAHGTGVITTSSKAAHVEESARTLDGAKLTQEQVDAITSAAKPHRVRGFWTKIFADLGL